MNGSAIFGTLLLGLVAGQSLAQQTGAQQTMAQQTLAQSGLTGTYYTGTNFEHKVLTRLDPQLNFNWSEGSPAPGLPHSYYSIRWTGKLRAPATGQYTFYAKVDDGIRIWVGNQKVMDSWQLNDSQHYTGRVVLEAGKYYDLRIDYFNDMLGGRLELFWQRPDAKASITSSIGTPGEPITAEFFFQKAPPTAPPPKPAPVRPVVASTPPKAVPNKPVAVVKPKPIPSPSVPKKATGNDTVRATYVPIQKPTAEPPVDMKPDTTFNLRQRSIQFEQSSYVLLPESSAELDQLVVVLKKHPGWRINVAGYTDNVGDPRLNLALSEYRAKIVAHYLVRQGIADDRITTAGYGSSRPFADNATEDGRTQNRRVVITRQ